ncbi:MAG: arsenate reductase (glutaredoxin) [Actinobacteria bacterium]|nr:arsenate reductase (glutaredoxin) [Actinomycetota bacterium]
MTEPVVWFNPQCSKCRTTQAILAEHGVDATYVDYRAEPPSVAELRRVMALLGTDDPRTIVRTGEPEWSDLGLADASDDEILEAMTAHPILIERPIIVRGDRAVIGRPPENVLDLID